MTPGDSTRVDRRMLYGFGFDGQNALLRSMKEISDMTVIASEASGAEYPKQYPPPRRRRQLDLLRLGGPALFHADHHLRVCALFRGLRGAGSGDRAGVVGICHRGRRPDDRADVADAGRHCRRQRPPQAVDRGIRRAAGDRLQPDVVRKARRSQHHPDAAAVLCDRQRRRRIRHRVQQRDDADPGAAGQDRAAVRHRLGHRLCRRHPQPDPGARLSRRQSGDRAHAVRLHAAVRPRPGDACRATASPGR